MAGRKRTSTTELNHDNWDQEEEPEEKGHMKVADQSTLETRNIIRASRKLGSGAGKGSTQSPFAGLSLFGASSSSSTLSFGTTVSSPTLFTSLDNQKPVKISDEAVTPSPTLFASLASQQENKNKFDHTVVPSFHGLNSYRNVLSDSQKLEKSCASTTSDSEEDNDNLKDSEEYDNGNFEQWSNNKNEENDYVRDPEEYDSAESEEEFDDEEVQQKNVSKEEKEDLVDHPAATVPSDEQSTPLATANDPTTTISADEVPLPPDDDDW